MSNRRRPTKGDPRKRPIREKRIRGTDPRRAGGTYAGPGGAFDRDSQVVDTTDSVLVDDAGALIVHFPDGRDVIGLLLSGRINRTEERSSVLSLVDVKGAAQIVAELIGVAVRDGGRTAELLSRELDRALEALPKSPADEASR